MKGFIVYSTYDVIDNKTIVQIYGRLENGQSFVALNKIMPYFYIKEKDLEKIKKLTSKYEVEKTNLANFEGEKVTKISADTQAEINKLHQAIHKDVTTYEADIKPHMRFLIDNNILGAIEIKGDYESSEKIDRIYKTPEVSAVQFTPKLKIASIDIESDKNTGKLFCLGIYSEKEKKVLMITKNKLKDTIQCKDEIDCLEKFKSELVKLDPDIITGWNLINFDLVYLKELFNKNKIPFDIGRNNENIRLRIESGFFRSSTADIPGRQVLDALNLIRDPFIKEAPTIKHAEFESYTLEDVSQALLNSGKLIKGKSRHEEIGNLYKKNTQESHQKLADYNLNDCKLVYDILEKTKMIDLAIERSQLTGLPLDRISGSIIALDSLYIRKAKSRNLVCPTTRFGNKEERITGGYVESLNPGIYNNVLVLDFKSLYPSIIKTFNIDPASYLEKKEKGAIESPNKAYFKNNEGILPEIITKLHDAREKAKREKRELSSYAIKIIMNSFFGVLASPNCRFFNLKMANAITHFGQFIIKLTAKEIEKLGHKVIYMDTDSTFVETNLEKTKANELGKKIEFHINNFYKDYVKKNYDRQSFLELQFEKQYLSMIIPKLRKQEAGAKKRYAGLIEKNGKEELEVTGLESIRGDWTEAAQEFQKELLIKLFHKENIVPFIKSYIKNINEGKLDSKLIYRKSIRKSLEEYTKTTPPHVKAARQLDKIDSNLIEYYQTTEGPEPIQKLKHKIDYEHYIEKQIKPIANQVLMLLNKDFDSLIQNSKQAKLF
ncbi:MAG: DNA polymerase II [Nanoarchaeota archaeon]